MLLGKIEQLRLSYVQGVLTALARHDRQERKEKGEEADMEVEEEEEEVELSEVECMVANLIFQGYVKGYISHKHATLVLSKKDPFPKLQPPAVR